MILLMKTYWFKMIQIGMMEKKDYVNCTIQYPNYWYYKRVKDNNYIFPDWAIIFIDPIVATLETTQFCPVNAAKRYGAYIKKRI